MPDEVLEAPETISTLQRRLRAAEDTALRLETRLDAVDAKHDDLRAELKAELLDVRRKINLMRDQILISVQDLGKKLDDTRSLRSWLIGALAAGGGSVGAGAAVSFWHILKTTYPQWLG